MLLPCDKYCRQNLASLSMRIFGMPEFSQNCLDCISNLLSNINDADSNSNWRWSNLKHNVSNEGIPPFFKNIDNSLWNVSDLELLSAFLIGCFGDGGVSIKLFGMFSRTDCRSLGLDFRFVFKTGKPGGNILHKQQYLGYLAYFPLKWLFYVIFVLLDLMVEIIERQLDLRPVTQHFLTIFKSTYAQVFIPLPWSVSTFFTLLRDNEVCLF